jgi:hypothetical protein
MTTFSFSRRILRLALLAAACCLLAAVARGANDADATKDDKAAAYVDLVQADNPVAFWRFEQGKLASVVEDAPALAGTVTGNVKLRQAGPQQAKYPGFDGANEAAQFDGKGSRIRIADPGDDSPLDFAAGDSLTLEAWVNPSRVGQMYIVGKGRTGNAGSAADNQNYALRLLDQNGAACLNFLFREEATRPGTKESWHRWTSNKGFGANSGWHHVAVTYTFGKGNSLRGYIDGKAVDGKWDYGGKTDAAPVVDNDEVWIGAGMGGATGNSFQGSIDEVAIYRTALSADRIGTRYQAILPKPYITNVPLPRDKVLVEILEGLPDDWNWNFIPPQPIERYTEQQFALPAVPRKYNEHGVQIDRGSPYVLWLSTEMELPTGEQRLLIRSRSAARLYLDDKLIAENPFQTSRTDGHNEVDDVVSHVSPNIRAVQPGDSEKLAEVSIAPGEHRVRLEVFIGGKRRRPEPGELSVSIAPAGSDDFRILSPSASDIPLTDTGWWKFESRRRAELTTINQQRRRQASAEYAKYWDRRHDWAREYLAKSPAPAVPNVKDETVVFNDVDRFVQAKLDAAGVAAGSLASDEAFLRRIYLDTIGLTPTAAQVAEFLADPRPDRRGRLIDSLLDQPGWADNWVGYWQDVLAENPNIINPTLNNTGPFRGWIYESLLDNKPLDRFATELSLMEGSLRYGGPAGFAMASENDAPMAAKAHILGRAFLAMEMQCARCHDAPFHPYKQEDLFNMAAMLSRGPLTLPKTSTVPVDPAAQKSLIITISLKPGQKIVPRWPIDEYFQGELPREFMENPSDAREEFALRMTSPQNTRFARVMANRLWQKYLGRGLFEPIDDWTGVAPEQGELLDFLARELITHDYDQKHIARLIFHSHTYQREPTSDLDAAKTFAAPLRRRMTAEQILDSLYTAAGKGFHTEDLNIDVEGSRLETSSINLGPAVRAWQFTSLSNERDRPSLSLPAVQSMLNLLEAFGWRASRQDPLTIRDQDPTVLQPAILANGVAAKRIAQFSEDSAFTTFALEEGTVDSFVNKVYRQILSRDPRPDERELFVAFLGDGFDARRTGAAPGPLPTKPKRDGVSWSNHLHPKANELKVAFQRIVEQGDPPTTRLTADWRERAEDFVWAIVNSPEYVFIP